MSLKDKRLEDIEESDLQALIDNAEPERKTLEYKRELPGKKTEEKKEFLADVSSFANAAGGYLIFGMEEDKGVPTNLCGLQDINPDAEIQCLDNRIRDGVAPRIPGVSMREIPLARGGFAIVIRIPRSWALPHMVTLGGSSRFYSRCSKGKYPLDVSEIRAAFALSESTAERIRGFRTERLGKIIAEETPVPLGEGEKIVLHIVPFGSFGPGAVCDLSLLTSQFRAFRVIDRVWPVGHCPARGSLRYNFDGLFVEGQLWSSEEAWPCSYVQVFRNGSIEAVDTYLIRNNPKGFPISYFEGMLIEVLPGYLSDQQRIGVEPPLLVMVSLLGVRGYEIDIDPLRRLPDEGYPIDRDDLLIPEVIVDSFECDPAEALKPVFDAVWNAGGYPRSKNYNPEDGQRIKRD